MGNKTPLWQQAAVVKTSIGDAVAVPIKYENLITMQAEGEKTSTTLEKISYLLIYKDTKQNMQAEWVTLAPIGEKKNGKFVGILDIKNWNSEFKRGYAFGENGDMAPVTLSNSVYKKINNVRGNNCFSFTNNYYAGVYGEVLKLTIIYTYCFTFSDGNSEIYNDSGIGDGGVPMPDDYTKVLDCAGVVGGTAKFSAECQTCIGGTTGIEKCPTKNPCDEVKTINQKAQNQQLKDASNELSKKPGDKEYGYEEKLVALSGDKYKEPNISSNGTHRYTMDFTWNDTDGYTIGFSHKHTVGTAPSPGDVMSPFTFAYNPALIRSGQQQFYKDNLTVTTLTDGNVYQITIADWDAIKDIYDKNSIDELNAEYQKFAEKFYYGNNETTSAMQNSEYALMKMFGSAINLYKKELGATNFTPYKIDINDNVIKNPCK